MNSEHMLMLQSGETPLSALCQSAEVSSKG